MKISNTTPRLRITGLIACGALLVGLVGCGTTNEGAPKSHRLESRLPSEGTQLGSADLVVASDRAVESIAERLREIHGEEADTVIVMDRIGNETSDRTANFQIYLARIRSNLNQSGARYNLRFVETRRRAEEIKQTEGIPESDSARTRPTYALTGVFYDMPRGGTNYYLLTFQLMDLRDDIVVWEGDYEVKL